MKKRTPRRQSSLCVSGLHLFAPAAVLCLVAQLAGTSQAVAAGLGFSWIRTGDPVNDAGVSAGLAWGDYDGDADADLFIANWQNQPNLLYRNDGDGTFTRITTGAIATDREYSSGPAWGDYDNDGDLDLFVANQRNQHNALYRNDGKDGFVRLTGQDITSDFGDSYSAAWADFDGDGLLDLFVSNAGDQPDFLYHNQGEDRFRRISEGSLVTEPASSHGASWGDMDDDGDPDLFIATAGNEPNRLYRNDGGGSFTPVVGLVTAVPIQSNGGAWGDYDNDGDLDLFVANGRFFIFGVADTLYRNEGGGNFTEAGDGPIVSQERASAAASWIDADQDGDLDLLVVHYADGNTLFLNDGSGGFSEYGELVPLGICGFSTGHGWADYDQDGDADLALANWENQNNNLYANTTTGRHWLRIRLRGVRSNRSGIGTVVRLATGNEGRLVWQRRDITAGTSFRSQDAAEALFGLGERSTVARLRIEWPSGQVDEFADLAADRLLEITEGQGISRDWQPPVPLPPVADLLYEEYVVRGAQAARDRYFALRETAPDAHDYSEDGLRPLINRLYGEGRLDDLVALAQLGVEAFPASLDAAERLINICSILGRHDDLAAAYRHLAALLESGQVSDLDAERRRRLGDELGYQRKHGCLRQRTG